jgi:hypothetical protein
VVNDNRDWDSKLDPRDWPPTHVQLVAMAGEDDFGSPALIVMLPHEQRLW